MTNDELYGASLDLFAEQRHRRVRHDAGAESVFVESNRKAAACIQENLKFTRLASDEVLVMDRFRALDLLAVQEELSDFYGSAL